MSKFNAMQALDEIMQEIKNHRAEWAGMLGTVWEREDWQRKQQRKNQLIAIIAA